MLFRNKNIDMALKDDEVLSLGWYFSSRHGKKFHNSDNLTRSILALTGSNENTINQLANLLRQILADDILLVPAPPSVATLKPASTEQPASAPAPKTTVQLTLHDCLRRMQMAELNKKTKISKKPLIIQERKQPKLGVTKLVTSLSITNPARNGHLLLQREKDLLRTEKGYRTVEMHMASMQITNPEFIRGKTILLIDDVVITGNTLSACRKKLILAGAAQVYCLVIGKTYNGNLELHHRNLSEAQLLLRKEVTEKSTILRENWANYDSMLVSLKKEYEKENVSQVLNLRKRGFWSSNPSQENKLRRTSYTPGTDQENQETKPSNRM